MAISKNYLSYPKRKHGMDHDIYPWSSLPNRRKIQWPNDKSVALWITIALEYFPLIPNDTPVRALGAMVTPYPDYRTYTAREYGNRVGIFRILKVLDTLGLKASFPTNTAIATRYPFLLREIISRGHEIVGHGLDMNAVSYGGMPKNDEHKSISKALNILREKSGQNIKGWRSPAGSHSENTLELLVENNIEYACDWANDDMPYTKQTPAGKLIAMPYTTELEDRNLLTTLGQNERTYQEQVLAAFELFTNESVTNGGRILHLALTPYVIGQAWRIQTLKDTLEIIVQTRRIWSATGIEISDLWQRQLKGDKNQQ